MWPKSQDSGHSLDHAPARLEKYRQAYQNAFEPETR
jgi:hypothetical protein